MKNLILSLLFVAVSTILASAQTNTKRAVILINSVATEVTLSATGDIIEIHGEEKNHMKKYINQVAKTSVQKQEAIATTEQPATERKVLAVKEETKKTVKKIE